MKKEDKRTKTGPKNGHRHKTLVFRKQVVAELDSGAYAIRDLAEKYGVSYSTISNWRYQVELHETGPDPQESLLDMERIANEIILGVYSKSEAISRYRITKPIRIRYWVERVRKANSEARLKGKTPNSPISSMKRIKSSTSEEVVVLNNALEEANLRILALETLIEVAKRDLGVDIRKKRGTKQSGK